MKKSEFLAGVRVITPLAVGAAVFGLTLGLAAVNAGLSKTELALMSGLVFAGASQLVAINMIDIAAPASAILIAVFAVNARHLLMSASIAPVVKGASRPARTAALLLIVDESWALTMARARSEPTGVAFIFGMGSVLWAVWMISTWAGATFGALLPNPQALALDFLGVAVFIGLLIIINPGKDDVVPFAVTAVLSPLLGTLLPGTWNIIAAAIIGAGVAVIRR